MYHDECPKCFGPRIDPACKDCGYDVEEALREENARLVKYHRTDGFALALQDLVYREAEVRKLTRERDEARDALKGLDVCYAEAQDIAVSESVGRRSAEAEVARLEGQAQGYFENAKAHREEARAEILRLRKRVEELERLNHEVVQDEIEWRNKAAERLERAEAAEAEVKRLEEEVRLTSLQRDQWKDAARTDLMEVKRLEGLILSSCDGNQGATAVVSNASALWAEARRIRAQREEGR